MHPTYLRELPDMLCASSFIFLCVCVFSPPRRTSPVPFQYRFPVSPYFKQWYTKAYLGFDPLDEYIVHILYHLNTSRVWSEKSINCVCGSDHSLRVCAEIVVSFINPAAMYCTVQYCIYGNSMHASLSECFYLWNACAKKIVHVLIYRVAVWLWCMMSAAYARLCTICMILSYMLAALCVYHYPFRGIASVQYSSSF